MTTNILLQAFNKRYKGRRIAIDPELIELTGSLASAYFLSQVMYRFGKSGDEAFYKYQEPCDAAKEGDSWAEELHLNRRQFENAKDAVATKSTYHTRNGLKNYTFEATDAGMADAVKYLVIYWIDASHKTYWWFNDALFFQLMLYQVAKSEEWTDDAINRLFSQCTKRTLAPMYETYISIYTESTKEVPSADGKAKDVPSDKADAAEQVQPELPEKTEEQGNPHDVVEIPPIAVVEESPAELTPPIAENGIAAYPWYWVVRRDVVQDIPKPCGDDYTPANPTKTARAKLYTSVEGDSVACQLDTKSMLAYVQFGYRWNMPKIDKAALFLRVAGTIKNMTATADLRDFWESITAGELQRWAVARDVEAFEHKKKAPGKLMELIVPHVRQQRAAPPPKRVLCDDCRAGNGYVEVIEDGVKSMEWCDHKGQIGQVEEMEKAT